ICVSTEKPTTGLAWVRLALFTFSTAGTATTRSSTSGATTRFIGSGVTAANLTFNMSGYDLLVSYGAPGDQIRINAQDLGPWFGNQIETLVYGDGTSISLTGGLSIIGSAGDDTLNGTAYNDTLQGGAGNDTLNGGGGNDIYVFNQGDGSDVINEA